MSEKKVIFHPLERLDLIDVDALQAQVLDYLAQVLGNLLGRDQVSADLIGATLAKPSSVTVNNGGGGAYTINLSDFTFIEMKNDTPVARSRQSRVVTYDSSESFHDLCDFSQMRSYVQTYYDANSALPPVPTQDASYSETTHGVFYPFIWVRSEDVNALQDTRRFWSVANGQESTSTVATRSDRAVRFAVQFTKPSGDWVQIARIVQWSLSGSTVELQPAGVVFLTLADTLVPLPTFGGTADEARSYYDQFNTVNDANDFSGLLACFRAVQNELALIRSGGSIDASYGTTLTNMTRPPRLSLDGLYDRTVSLNTQFREVRQLGSAVFTLEANRPAGEYNFTVQNNSVISSALPRVTLAGSPDYSLVFNKTSPPSAPLAFGGAQFDPSQNVFLRNWVAALSMFTVEVPASFAGAEIRVNPVVVAAIVDDYNTNNSTAFEVIGTSNEKFAPLTAMLITGNPSGNTDYNDTLRVGLLQRTNASDQAEAFYGVRIGIAGIDELLTSTNVQLYKVRIAVKVDVELVEI